MTKMIVFDMDGTIADLYGVEGWLEMLEAENAAPYVEAGGAAERIASCELAYCSNKLACKRKFILL